MEIVPPILWSLVWRSAFSVGAHAQRGYAGVTGMVGNGHVRPSGSARIATSRFFWLREAVRGRPYLCKRESDEAEPNKRKVSPKNQLHL